MTRSAIILAMVSALFLGVSLGFMGGVLFSHHHQLLERHAGWRDFHGGRRGPGSPHALLSRLNRLLDLTPAQSDAVRAEIERTRADFAVVRDSLRTRIERHLTSDQRQRWRAADEMHPGDPRGPDPRTLRAEPGRDPGPGQ